MTVDAARAVWEELLRGSRFVATASASMGLVMFNAEDVDRDEAHTFGVHQLRLDRMRSKNALRRLLSMRIKSVVGPQ